MEYQVRREGESLTASLWEEDGIHKIRLVYTKPNGDTEVSIFKHGMRVGTRATHANGTYPVRDSEGNTFLNGVLVAYDRLGPELREQIPSEWHAVLGKWLAPKEE